MLKQTIIRTPAGAAPAQKPAGAMSSVFDTAAAVPTSPTAPQDEGQRSRDRKRQLVLDGLQKGEASGGNLARLLGISQSTVSIVLRELIAEGLVESNGASATSRNLRFRVKTNTAAGGFKAWLAKTGSTSAEGRAPRRMKDSPMQPTEPTMVTGHKATHTRRAEVRSETSAAPTWSCALESSGHLVIRANGQELALDAQQARGVAAWLQRVDAALAVALEAR